MGSCADDPPAAAHSRQKAGRICRAFRKPPPAGHRHGWRWKDPEDAVKRGLGATIFNMVLVPQKPGEYVANTRTAAGRVRNSARARELASTALQMPTDVTRLLPQLRRGEFMYVDGGVVLTRMMP
jgi:hypothetical protein